MQNRRVVVTGLGAVTPLGNNFQSFWESLIKGKSGAQPITLFDAEKFKTRFACEIKDLDFQDYFDRKEERKMDRFAKIGLIAFREAFADSGLEEFTNLDKDRTGVVWGTGIGGIRTFEDEVRDFYVRFEQTPRFNPFFIPKMIVDIVPGLISMEKGFLGPNYATVSACASSTNAIIDAYMLIKMNKADVMISGGSECAVTQAGMGGFNSLHALSTRNEDPEKASRPFDKDRDGFVLGEGSGCIVLEEYEHAKNRGATIYAELAGTGLTADAYHMTAPHPEGTGAKNVMRQCIAEAGMEPKDVDHINLHGTSTPLGDIAETKAIAELLGDAKKEVVLNSTKSMTGHLLGAAGIVEAIATVATIRFNKIPPTINLDNKDPEIDSELNICANTAMDKDVSVAMSNTFGFGGHNASILFKRL